MKQLALSAFAATLLAASVPANAQFSLEVEEEILTVAEIESALSVTGTSSIPGVALGPANSVYLIHENAGDLTVGQIDLDTKSGLWTKSEVDIVSDLSLSGNLTLTAGEFVYDPVNDRLVLSSDIGAVSPGDPWTVFAIDTSASPYTASVILRDASIQGWNSHDILSDGTIVGALGEEFEVLVGGEPKVGYLNESVPEFVDLFDVDDFQDATQAGSGDQITGELPPETIGVDTSDDTVYVFAHDNFELFSLDGISSTDPVDIEISGWDDSATPTGDRVDLHGLDVDGNGNVFGFDERAEAVVVWDGGSETLEILFSDVASSLGGGALEVTVWRGMKARALNSSETEVFLAPSNSNYGLVRLLVEDQSVTSVNNWEMYR